MSEHRSFLAGGLGIAALTIALDQAHKWYMLQVVQIRLGETIRVLPFFDWRYVKNEGISYGLFTQESETGQWVLAGFAGLAAVLLGLWLARGVTNLLMAASVGLIMGGAISNAIDRLLLGGVADFFSLHAFGFYWYVFNIADVAIVAGVVGLLYDSFMPSRNDAQKSTQ
ncbi:MAG: signal peptidase II [Hyphomicrobiaceae bacterium]|nr:signal peptidase II [Hyphomicrobiaceae bacterium]